MKQRKITVQEEETEKTNRQTYIQIREKGKTSQINRKRGNIIGFI
jgi:hypothetical protein